MARDRGDLNRKTKQNIFSAQMTMKLKWNLNSDDESLQSK